jgi:hypothetical protein
MAQTNPDITIPTEDFVSINTLSGIAVGTAMTITNKSSSYILLAEGTKPAATSEDGVLVSPMSDTYAIADIPSGSLEIWAKSISFSSKVSVQ